MDEAARKLQRRRLLVTLAATLLGLLAGLVQAYRRPLPYEATSVLQLFFRSAPANRQGRLSKGGMTDMQELMMGRTFREDVLDRLAPADRTRLLGAGTLQPGKHEAAQRSAQASSALEGLVVEVVPSTQLMTISFASKDPHLATAVVTAAVSVAQDIGLRLRMERTARLNVSLGDRLDELERNIAEAEKQEAATQQRLGSADPSQLGQNRLTRSQRLALQPMDRHALKVARRQGKLVGVPTPVIDGGTTGPDQLLSVLREASVKARLTERLEQTRAAAFQSLESSGNQDVLEGQARGPERRELDGIRDTLGQEQTRASMLEQKVGPEEPSMQSLSAELKETRRQRQQADKNLVAAAQHDAVQAKLRADALSAAFEQRRKTVGQQVAAERREALPELSLDVDEDLDERQRLVLRSAQVNAALQASGFYVLDQPTVPRKRIARSYQISLASGAAGGLLLGVFANLVLFARARRRWTVATAAQEGWSSVAAVLPRSDPERSRPGAAPGNDLEVLRSPQSLYSTALTELQNKLEALPRKRVRLSSC